MGIRPVVGALFGSSKASAQRICLCVLGLAVTLLVKAQGCDEPSWVPTPKIENLRVGLKGDCRRRLLPMMTRPAPEHRAPLRFAGRLADLDFDAKLGQLRAARARAPLTIHRVTIARPSASTIPEGDPPRSTHRGRVLFSTERRPYPQNRGDDLRVGPSLLVMATAFKRTSR